MDQSWNQYNGEEKFSWGHLTIDCITTERIQTRPMHWQRINCVAREIDHSISYGSPMKWKQSLVILCESECITHMNK